MTDHPRAFVVGHPIAHSRSPLIHGHWLAEYGIRGSYERLDVAPEALPAFLRDVAAGGFVGGNVTLPHKEVAFRLVDEVVGAARRVGAVNTLFRDGGRLQGASTDGYGFVASLEAALGPAWREGIRAALVLGAGGAARSVAGALLDLGIAVRVANRTPERVRDLLALDPARMTPAPWEDLGGALATTDLLVNTTSLGMTGQPPLDLDLAPLSSDAIVADIVYVPLETPLLAAARRRGLRTVDGLGMLLHQAVPGFARWFGVTPAVTPALRARLVADVEGRGR